jgi:rhamnulokinase
MGKQKKFLAFDIGASNGRCVVGSFDGSTLGLEVLTRFENFHVRIHDHLHWDMLGLFSHMKDSLRKAVAEYGSEIAGIGVDTWGLDFALLDKQGNLIGNPFMYRDPQTEGMLEEAYKMMPREEIFEITGLQFMRINTLYQLLAMVKSNHPALEVAHTFLTVPDLLNYWLSGRAVVEYTNASTTQLLDARTRGWSLPLIRAMGIPERIFPEIIEAGEVLGNLQASVMEETGMPKAPVFAPATHDTGSAVVSVPADTEYFAYLSSGTWGLLGTELPEPLLTPKVQKYNFGNEGGVCGTIRLLRNITNMWIPQECRRIWTQEGLEYSWDDLCEMAAAAPLFIGCVDPNAPEFLLPQNMPVMIRETCAKTGQAVPQTHGEIIRVAFESLAFKYRYTIEELTDIVGKPPEVLHIVGGGSQNALLCQWAANVLNRPVVAGPDEATTVGNLVMQLIAAGEISNLEEGRALIRGSFPTTTYLPRETDRWEEAYQKFLKTLGLPSILV